MFSLCFLSKLEVGTPCTEPLTLRSTSRCLAHIAMHGPRQPHASSKCHSDRFNRAGGGGLSRARNNRTLAPYCTLALLTSTTILQMKHWHLAGCIHCFNRGGSLPGLGQVESVFHLPSTVCRHNHPQSSTVFRFPSTAFPLSSAFICVLPPAVAVGRCRLSQQRVVHLARPRSVGEEPTRLGQVSRWWVNRATAAGRVGHTVIPPSLTSPPSLAWRGKCPVPTHGNRQAAAVGSQTKPLVMTGSEIKG